MGNTCGGLDSSDWIDIIGICVNAGLAIWIGRTIQSRLTNKRTLKDHFISELKDIRVEYRTWMNDLYSNRVNPKEALAWFKLMNIKVTDLMCILTDEYNADLEYFKPYQIELRDLLTNNVDYISQFQNAATLTLSEASKTQFVKFEQQNNHRFNNMIVHVNKAS